MPLPRRANSLLAMLTLALTACAAPARFEVPDARRDRFNEALMRRFYEAFARRDAVGMAACYAPDARFSDPVFPDLRGPEVAAMWAMLCEQGRDLRVASWDFRADGAEGAAHWEAFYTFSVTGGRVHNRIDARFRFHEGRIVEHQDEFDLWAWTRMAIPGWGDLFGWSPLLQGALRLAARGALRDWMAAHPSPTGDQER